MYHPKHDEAKALQRILDAEATNHRETLATIYSEITKIREQMRESTRLLYWGMRKLDELEVMTKQLSKEGK